MQNLESSRTIPQSLNAGGGVDYTILDYFEVSETNAHDANGRHGIDELKEQRNYRFLWTRALNCILATLLILSPYLFDYKSSNLVMSDTVSGALILILEILSFPIQLSWLRWGTAIVGLWLLLAPLIFWAPIPAIYLNDTIIGALVITFSLVVAETPAHCGIDLLGPDQPPGWTYNPSSWIRRWLGIALALVGVVISRYLAAHQLGYTAHTFDPFFGNGTDQVLTSSVSRSFPVSDAGVGGVAYLLEVIIGFMGGRARWRTAPWIVVMYALLVLPLGVTSVVLVVTQPMVVGFWCGFCLIAATALLISFPLAVHEAIAVGQFLLEAKKQRKNLWRVFWTGGSITDGGALDPIRTRYSIKQRWIASIQGVTVPWTIFGQVALGVWLMARPDILSGSAVSANIDHICGALIVTCAVVSTAEVTRAVRFCNVPLAVGLIFASFCVNNSSPVVLYSDLVCGLLLILAAIPRGEIIEKYGNWDRFVK